MKAIILSKNNINKLKQYFNARTISKKNKILELYFIRLKFFNIVFYEKQI